jgi:UDP-N-acetylmuramyl tripeptide synthase
MNTKNINDAYVLNYLDKLKKCYSDEEVILCINNIYEDGFITIAKGEWKIRVIKAVNVPLTYGGKAAFMIQNVLPAVLTGYIQGFAIEDIRVALETFIPSPGQTPGRLNMFEFRNDSNSSLREKVSLMMELRLRSFS